MNKNLKLFVLTLTSLLICASCGVSKTIVDTKTTMIQLSCTASPNQYYSDLTYGLNIYTNANISPENIFDASEATPEIKRFIGGLKNIIIDPPVQTFVNNSLTTYARSMGINVGNSMSDNYSLRVDVKRFQIIYLRENITAIVELEYTLADRDNRTLLRQTSRGRYQANQNNIMNTPTRLFDNAFTEALQNMQWNDIAGYLRVNKRAEQEPTKKVQGDGNTALEHSIIRWNIVSSPGGADVYWRVVSSTPDVKNTNASYLGTTPYESTESFDIRGLTYENAGNIQIEIKCERNGYLPQTRRFNLLQVIDQKEISTKFNLVKDDE